MTTDNRSERVLPGRTGTARDDREKALVADRAAKLTGEVNV